MQKNGVTVRPIIGKLLTAIGVVHIAGVAVFYDDAVSTIVDDRVFDAVPDASGNADTAFWYLFAGFVLFIAAAIVHRLERIGGRPLAFVGWSFVALGAIGQIAKPTSPFVVFTLIGALAVWRSRSAPARRPVVGWLLGAVAAIHTVTVLSFYGDGLRDIIDDGVFNAAPEATGTPDAAFWFVFSGLGVLILAYLIHWIETNERGLLPPVAWSLVVLGGTGVLVKPTSGLWIPLALGLAAVIVASRDGSGPVPPSGRRESQPGVRVATVSRDETVAAQTVDAATLSRQP